MDTISQLLNLVDDDSSVIDTHIDGQIKYVTIEKNLRHVVCPNCGYKMHSKGKFKRHPKHQVLQDGYSLHVTLIGRQWKCTNPECAHRIVDQFEFIEPNKQITKLIELQVLHTMKDIRLSSIQIANQFHISDSSVQQIFMKHIQMKRKPLTECICIDEVYLNISEDCKYALIIMDFKTGEILDIVRSRRKKYTESYFYSIPKQERDNVKYLICDMYKPYINYTVHYFKNATPVIDSFHVLQWLLRLIRSYINDIKKEYQKRDRINWEQQNEKSNQSFQKRKDSREVYILKNGQWVMLRNRSNWKYLDKSYVRFLNQYLDTLDWEREFLALNEHFSEIRDLKDLYEEFNENFINDLTGAQKRLDELIKIYSDSPYKLFRDFARLLNKFYDPIISSFTYVIAERSDHKKDILRRLSNGPMESFNNIPSALRSQSHGLSNFEYTRNRILWSIRDDAPIRLNK